MVFRVLGSPGGILSDRLYLPPAFKIISENIARSGNPLSMGNKDGTAWAESLRLPGVGRTILYTGGEYQMASRIHSLVEMLKKVKFEDTALSAFSGLQAATGKLGINLTGVYTRIARGRSDTYNQILKMAAINLQRLGVEFSYLPDELYSGALLYEFGLFDEFARQALKVVKQFKEAGVSSIIALTPHSAEIFEEIYPQFVSGFDFEVIPYVCMVEEALSKSRVELSLPNPLSVTIHDPCHLARSLEVTEEPRRVLGSIHNLELREATASKQETVCCGAPAETIYPELSELLACRRAEELSRTGAEAAVMMCPFCYASLSKGVAMSGQKLSVVDFIELVYRAWGGDDVGP